MACRSVLAAALGLMLAAALVQGASVPLVAWSTGENVLPASAPLGAVLSAEEAGRALASALAKPHATVALFVADTLSIEDLSSPATPFAQTKTACEAAKSMLYLPNVRASPQLLPALRAAAAQQGATVVDADAPLVASGAETPALGAGATLVVLRLAESAGFAASDNIMHAAAARLAAAAPTAVLTVALTGEGQPMSLTQRLRSSEMLEAAVQRRRRDTSSKSNGARPATSPSYVALRPDQRHEEANVYFTIPILMGIIVILFMVSLFSIGVFGLMNVQTMERWPDAAHDKNLIVPQ